MLSVFLSTNAFQRVGDSQDDDASGGIRKRADRSANGRQVSPAALELRLLIVAVLDSLKDVTPFRLRSL